MAPSRPIRELPVQLLWNPLLRKISAQPLCLPLFQNKELKVSSNHTLAKKGTIPMVGSECMGLSSRAAQNPSATPGRRGGAGASLAIDRTPSPAFSTLYALPCVAANSCPVFSSDYALRGGGGGTRRGYGPGASLTDCTGSIPDTVSQGRRIHRSPGYTQGVEKRIVTGT